MQLLFRLRPVVFLVALLLPALHASQIVGRVQNAATGTYVNNARVSIDGTTLDAYTNQDGEFRLTNVPPGSVVVRAYFAGLEPQSARITVPADGSAEQDFALGLANVQTLDAFVVEATELSAQASAINEQRVAPNIKNVVAFEEFGNLSDGNIGEPS